MLEPTTTNQNQRHHLFRNLLKPILPESIIINEGTKIFCQQFKYLGSIISKDRRDDKEIPTRIKKGNTQFGALKNILLGKTL